MPRFPRKEVEETANRFAAANVRAESERDWGPLADFYTDDAVYTYVGLAAGERSMPTARRRSARS